MFKYKISPIILVLIFSMSAMVSGCTSSKFNTDNNGSKNKAEITQASKENMTSEQTTSATEQTAESTATGSVATENAVTGTTQGTDKDNQSETMSQADLTKIKPNESGKIMVVMFHSFIASYKSGDKQYTTTFDEFRKLLDTLYASDYRLINLNDFLDNKIDVPAGCIPMVFTFDDGTAGQFNLVDNNGKLEVNKQSAVGIIEEFGEIHPDFGLKGTFYINLGCQVFPGKGSVKERLEYLTSKGFEIGNHTLDHVNLKTVKTAEQVQKEIGGNQKKLLEILPGYTFTTLSLPYGSPAKELKSYVEMGEYDGLKYKNRGIMEVGWDPSVSPVSKKFNPLSIHRVRASGIVPVEADLGWWLKTLKKGEQYVSDGNEKTITVPKGKETLLDQNKLGGRQLITY